MPRQVDFGDDVDVALSGILDEVTKLFLGVETTVADSVIIPAVSTEDGSVAIGSNLGQFGILLDFDAPALVFRQVNVELVHVVQSHHVQINLHRVQVHIVAAHIEEHTTIGEFRPVADGAAGEGHLIRLFPYRQTFTQGLDAIKHPCRIRTFHSDLFRRNIDFVSLRLLEILWNNLQHNAISLVLICLLVQGIANNVVHIFAEELRFALEPILIINRSFLLQCET